MSFYSTQNIETSRIDLDSETTLGIGLVNRDQGVTQNFTIAFDPKIGNSGFIHAKLKSFNKVSAIERQAFGTLVKNYTARDFLTSVHDLESDAFGFFLADDKANAHLPLRGRRKSLNAPAIKKSTQSKSAVLVECRILAETEDIDQHNSHPLDMEKSARKVGSSHNPSLLVG